MSAHDDAIANLAALRGDVDALEQARRDAVSALEQCGDRVTALEQRNADLGAQVAALEAEQAERTNPARGAAQVVRGGLATLLEMARDIADLHAGGISTLYLVGHEHGLFRLTPELAPLLTNRTLRLSGNGAVIHGIEGAAPHAAVELWGVIVRGEVRVTASPGFTLRTVNDGSFQPARDAGPAVPV